MKGRFSTLDIGVIVKELKRLLGMRVVNVYDIDNKTYLIRIARPDEKAVLLLESGIRLHSTDFDWPKNPAPSGFSMKMRKHLKGRRFEKIEQLGVDRIVDMQFGSGEAAYHVILELYDRGNIVLTDSEYTILNILRPRTDNSQDVRFAVREQYPVAAAKHHEVPTEERLLQILQSAKQGDTLKRALVPHLDYGPAVLDHCLLEAGLSANAEIGKAFHTDADMPKLMTAIQMAETLMMALLSKPCKGYIIQRIDKKPNPKEGESPELAVYDEYHPFLFRQMAQKSNVEFDIFDKAVDEFFSKLESQKLDVKVLQQEKAALKKLDNVKKDHEKRINELQKEQDMDILRGQLIEMNLELVDKAILVVRSALANQIDWTEISQLVKEAQATGDTVAKTIVSLKLDINHITLLLHDPYEGGDDDEEEEGMPLKPMKVDIDLGLSAYANSRKFFDMKKQAARKEQKTLEASNKAMKSAEKKTKETLKDMATVASINKTRKTYWFEKFLWFISSENYLVIGGRDQQQNELLVKRYMKPGDLYVHADLHGASSVILKNPAGGEVPPKTLNEAGTMAICNSAAWDAKVVTSAWWVRHDQVSKTAPSGEYLTTGSFMIRGKKNYLPPSYLVYGFGFLFKLEDSSVERHIGERKVRTIEDDSVSVSLASEAESALSLGDIDEQGEENDAVSEDSGDENQGEAKQAAAEGEERYPEDSGSEQGDEGTGDVSDEAGVAEDKASAGTTEAGTDDKGQKSAVVPLAVEFPDTSINLTHVKGDRFELQRLTSVGSATSSATKNDKDDGGGGAAIYLGDDTPVSFGEKTTNRATGRLSAKQRREMRKAKKGGAPQQVVETETAQGAEEEAREEPEVVPSQDVVDDDEDETETRLKGEDSSKPQPAKRGQKNKKRKMKGKYGDQDEDERQLKMDLLAASGPHKEEKRKKGKKGKEENRAAKGGGKPTGRPQSGKGQSQGHSGSQPKSATNGSSHDDAADRVEMAKPVGFIKEEAQEGASEEEQDVAEEDGQPLDDLQILNSLTGQPHPEDELLYAVPCCAPYNALTAYKFKVKLLPGTTKRGKAAKTALNTFQHDKTAMMREKDLLRIMKDADLSRNMPGKVKVAAPNLHKK